jgi:hypothetical protein
MVIHQLADPRGALREVARVCRRLVIVTSDMTTRRLGILEEAFPSLLGIDRKRFPSKETLSRTVEDAGFQDVRFEDRPFVRELTVEEQLDRVRRRYLSTFELLPPGEFDRGLRFLEREMPRRHGNRFVVRATFTFLTGTR